MQPDTEQLVEFSKHIPKLLREQILCGLLSRYIASGKPADASQASGEQDQPHGVLVGPSIERFHGALLFVDISGFTALSLKLDVEPLKNHINEYFTRMLDIVERWEGDVIKFAGDALYIVWPTSVADRSAIQSIDENSGAQLSMPISQSVQFAVAAKRAVEKAVGCASEINSSCGNYEVRLVESNSDNTNLLSKMMPSFSVSNLFGTKVAPKEEVAFLNVHSGISCGLMAGVDIVHNDRAEFFLVGDPLIGVAMAESQASQGDVVMCPRAHELIHGDAVDLAAESQPSHSVSTLSTSVPAVAAAAEIRGGSSDAPSHMLSCGCCRTSMGMFLVSDQSPKVSRPTEKRRTRTSKTGNTMFKTEDQNAKILDEIQRDVDNLFVSSNLCIRKEFQDVLTQNRPGESSVSTEPDSSLRIEERMFSTAREGIKTHFSEWMSQSLLENSSFHVHEIARQAFTRNAPRRRLSSFHQMLRASMPILDIADFESSPPSNPLLGNSYDHSCGSAVLDMESGECRSPKGMRSPTGSIDFSAREPRSPSGSVDFSARGLRSPSGSVDFSAANPSGAAVGVDELDGLVTLKERRKRASKITLAAEAYLGELRTVIVMFIKIEKFDLRLKVDAPAPASSTSTFSSSASSPSSAAHARSFSNQSFSFLERTASELEMDNYLLSRFQSCFAVLCQVMNDNGGQLRQFIVDDKGTVCIGTFGLRSSTAVDSAAAALEAAKSILEDLSKLDLHASIGITSGKAYCGLVGSLHRHEYAIMGPSTNLSARLMCKAPTHGVLCDADTVTRDRTHKFNFVADVIAKGYSKAVSTFSPDFGGEDVEYAGRKLVHASSSSFKMKDRAMHRVTLKNNWKEAANVIVQANLATHNKLSATQKLHNLIKTDFYIRETMTKLDAAAHQKNISHRLYGRSAELEDIFSFLFENDTQNPQALQCTSKAKMMVTYGTSGIGKAALLDAMERKLLHMVRTDLTCNLVVLYNRTLSSLPSDPPFRSWQGILIKLLMNVEAKLNASNAAAVAAAAASKKNGHSLASSAVGGASATIASPLLDGIATTNKIANFENVINCLWPLLPKEFYDKKPLLAILALNSEDDGTADTSVDTTISVLNEEHLSLCTALVAALLTAASKVLSKLLFIIVHVQGMDKWSLATLLRVWKESQGVVIVASFNTTLSSSASVDAEDGVVDSPLPSTLTSSDAGGDNVRRFFRTYSDPVRFRMLELKPLVRAAAAAMIKESCPDLGEEDTDKLCTASVGNPLYLAELIKAIMKAPTVEERSRCISQFSTVAGAAIGVSSVDRSASFRVQEVIYYRLDQLQLPSQILLKAVAVAVSYGRPCRLDMLKFILEDSKFFLDTASNPATNDMVVDASTLELRMQNIQQALVELIQADNSFLAVLNADSSPIPKSALTVAALSSLRFAFRTPLEQVSIYGLIVDEQKEYFHERAATYLHKELRAQELSEMAVGDLWEKAFHWHAAQFWSRALRAYLLAAKKSKQDGNLRQCTESLLMGYRIYQAMEREVANISMPEKCYGMADRIAECLFRQTPSAIRELEASEELIVALRTAQEVFEPDPFGLSYAIDLHIMLAEAYLYQWADFTEVMRLLTVGVLLCAASVWKPSTVAPEVARTLPVRRGRKSTAVIDPTLYIAPRHVLIKYDYLQLFTLCAYTTRFVSLEIPFMVSFEHSKTLLLQDDGNEYDANSEVDDDVTLVAIHTHVMIALRYLDLGKPSRAATLLDKALAIYSDPSVQSNYLAKRYSADFVPYALALLSQALLMGRDLNTGIEYWHKALEYLHVVSHDYSFGIAAIVLMSTAHFLQGYKELLALLKKRQRRSLIIPMWLNKGGDNRKTGHRGHDNEVEERKNVDHKEENEEEDEEEEEEEEENGDPTRVEGGDEVEKVQREIQRAQPKLLASQTTESTRVRPMGRASHTLGTQLGHILEMWLSLSMATNQPPSSTLAPPLLSPSATTADASLPLLRPATNISAEQIDRFLELSNGVDQSIALSSDELLAPKAAELPGTREASSLSTTPPAATSATAASFSMMMASPSLSHPAASLQADITISKLTFLELHGCALERIGIEIMCMLWSAASKSHLYHFDQRIQGNLQILLQSPVHDYMSTVSKALNMFHCLGALQRTMHSPCGPSAGGVYVAVTERAEQCLLALLHQLLAKEVVFLGWLLSRSSVALPLHATIRDEHQALLKEVADRVGSFRADCRLQDTVDRLVQQLGLPCVPGEK